ncbi:MAG: glycosyltransferase [Candidatus Omnitrophica bacterium]|nr:glycosyltransferase [Candidatus Omnitrophota bacterium]
MKILHITPCYKPAWAFGGPVNSISLLCQQLVKLNNEMVVYTTNSAKEGILDVPVGKTVEVDGVKVIYFPCSFKKDNPFYSSALNKKVLSSVKEFDIVHVSSIWQYHQIAATKACKKYEIPCIISTRGSFQRWPLSQKSMKKRIYWFLFGKKSLKDASALHFTSLLERKETLEAIPYVSNFIVPNGINIDPYYKKRDIRKEIGISPDAFLFLFLGRIHRKKGIDLIIKALNKIRNKNVFFLIVGKIDDKSYFNDLKRLVADFQLKSKVIFYGGVPKEEVKDFYSNSDLMVLTSHSENFANVVPEAMGCGLPVFISRYVGIWQEVLIDEAGFVVDCNVEKITQKLKEIVTNREILNGVSSNAIKSAQRRYSLESTASLMMQAYEDVLINKRSDGLQWE